MGVTSNKFYRILLFVVHCFRSFIGLHITSSAVRFDSPVPVNITECSPGRGCFTVTTVVGSNDRVNLRKKYVNETRDLRRHGSIRFWTNILWKIQKWIEENTRGIIYPVEVEQCYVSDSPTKVLAEVLVKLAVNKQRIKGIYLHRLKWIVSHLR